MSAARHWILLDLRDAFNNDGISWPHDPADGAFNVWGNTFPAEELPAGGSEVRYGGIPFRFPPTDDAQPNNVVCAGQEIALPEGVYAALHVLGASEWRTEDMATLEGPAGQQSARLALSGWWSGCHGHFGNRLALRCSCLHYPRHIQPRMAPQLWRHSVRLRLLPARCLRLPDNPALHLFALTLESLAP